MPRHIVSAQLNVEADDWDDAEAFVRRLPDMMGPAADFWVECVKWEATLEEEE